MTEEALWGAIWVLLAMMIIEAVALLITIGEDWR